MICNNRSAIVYQTNLNSRANRFNFSHQWSIWHFARPNLSFKKQVTVTTRRVLTVKIVPIELPPSKSCVSLGPFFLFKLLVFSLRPLSYIFKIVNTLWLFSETLSVFLLAKKNLIFYFQIYFCFLASGDNGDAPLPLANTWAARRILEKIVIHAQSWKSRSLLHNWQQSYNSSSCLTRKFKDLTCAVELV